MAERPILFSAPMVRAILDGRKTQTRRVMKPQPEKCPPDYPRPGHWWSSRLHQTMLHIEDEMQNGQGGWEGLAASACPYGDKGERLWVREAFMPMPTEAPPDTPRETKWEIEYAAGGSRLDATAPAGYDPMLYNYARWSPSIHMPRWASRITLEITGVRVERLQAISEADAEAEGVAENGERLLGVTPYRARFFNLWESINGAGSWDANPWVWVVEFRRVQEVPRG